MPSTSASWARRPRVFIIGSDNFDSVGRSYQSTLEPHYEVRLLNPHELIPARLIPGGRARPNLLTVGVSIASRLALGDPIAVSLPRLVRSAREFQPDIVLITPIAALSPETIAAIRAAVPGAMVVGVFSDSLANFERGYFFLAKYDAIFFKDHFIVDKLRTKLGRSYYYYLPQACDPAIHHRVELSEEDRRTFSCDITIAGNVHTFRAAEFEPLIGRNMKIWGGAVPRWLKHPIRQHCVARYVAGEDKCRAMLAARIVLNANHYSEINGTNKRTFEVAAIGAFQLTDTPALSDVFGENEVASFDSQSDMIEKIDYYLDRPALRRQMAERAHERAHREHTYAHRWTAKMMALGQSVPSSFPVQPNAVSLRAQ